MKSTLHRLPLIAIALIVLAATMSAKSDWDKDARSRKAEYIFLESQSAYCEMHYDKYIAMLERAYGLDSTDLEIANEWALLSFMDENTDSLKATKAYDLIKRHYYANPKDYISGVIFSNTARRLGHFDDAVKVWETLDSIYPTRPDIALKRAESYLSAFAGDGDSLALDKAMAIYDRMEQGSGRSVELSAKKLYVYYAKDDTIAAINELDSLYAHAPNDSYTSLFIGINYNYLDMPEQSIFYLNRACELDSTSGTAYLSRARFYLEQNDSVAYDREVFLALKSQNLDVSSKVEILQSYVSELYADTTQETRIRQLFDELQQMHPGEPDIHSLYGAYLYELGDYDEATEQYSYVAALNPTDERSWMVYVQSALRTADNPSVIKATAEAVEQFPENLYFPLVLSTYYHIDGDDQKALEVLDSVKITERQNPELISSLFSTKGDIYASVGDTIQALSTYDIAIEYNPDNAMALNNAAYFMAISHGDLDKAEQYSARSLKGDELNPTYLDTYAWIFFLKKDYKMAKQYIDFALNAYAQPNDSIDGDVPGIPSDDTSIDEIEEVYAEEVVVAVAEEEEAETPSADIYDHAGDIYFMNGETDRALEFWQKALELDPNDPIVQKKVNYKTIFFR